EATALQHEVAALRQAYPGYLDEVIPGFQIHRTHHPAGSLGLGRILAALAVVAVKLRPVRQQEHLPVVTQLAHRLQQMLANRQVVQAQVDRKSTRLNSSHVKISYAVFCLKKKKKLTPSAPHALTRRRLRASTTDTEATGNSVRTSHRACPGRSMRRPGCSTNRCAYHLGQY